MRFNRSLRIVLTLIYFFTCCYLFFTTGNEFPQEDWLDKIYFDKWVHLGLFAVLALLLCWSEFGRGRRQVSRVALAGIAYGAAVEVIQGLWVPHRSADIFDFLFDSLGVGVGLYIWRRWGKKSKPL
ncbi:MAG: VanZ family protein [Chitinophagaceae bacterium]|nr:MAG: VanZ family protein [Chitinophagaceae bacterium]